jgi:hypothetical protein
MKLRMGFFAGLTVGYYLGAMAGRERYQQLNRLLGKVSRSSAMGKATDKTKAVVDLGMDRAKEGVSTRIHRSNGSHTSEPSEFSPS